MRNALYSRNILSRHKVSGVKVISVGNLNVGGTGKTPAVIHLAQLYASHGRKVAVLTRGYGRQARTPAVLCGSELPTAEVAGDEPLLIARRCPEATVLVGEDRVALAERAREMGAEVILLDDGMQYHALCRDLEVVVINEAIGFGNGKLLPRGPLREPPTALRRADLLWLRGDGKGTAADGFGVPWIRVRDRIRSVLSDDGEPQATTALQGRSAYAFAGLAQPGDFRRTLEELGAKVVGSQFFSDHHLFSERDLAQLSMLSKSAGAELLVTTEKDRMRLPHHFRTWTVAIDVEVVEGEERLARMLGLT